MKIPRFRQSDPCLAVPQREYYPSGTLVEGKVGALDLSSHLTVLNIREQRSLGER